MKETERENLLPGIASVIIPAIQLLALLIINLTQLFQIAEIFIFENLINLVNLFIILITSSTIGYFWYLQQNYHWVRKQDEAYNPQAKINSALKISIYSSFIGLIIFIAISIVGGTHTYRNVFGWLQLCSYSVILIASGFAMYIWLTEYINKKKRFKQEDFIPRLLKVLEEYGHLKRRDVVIHSSEYKDMVRNLIITIENEYYEVSVSFDASEIKSIKKLNA